MLKLDYTAVATTLKPEKIQAELEKIRSAFEPDFVAHEPDLAALQAAAQKYAAYKNIILIGNGGSRTSSWAFYHGLADFRNAVNFEFLSSAEPELLQSLRKKYRKKNTLIVAVSKSGSNINLLEPLLALADYPGVVVTEDKDNVLSELAAKLGWEKIIHPEVGGRFSAMTSCALFPAALMGLPLTEIYQGAQKGYARFGQAQTMEQNEALKLAAYLLDLEEAGYREIFTSIYSSSLFATLPLIIQLIHETAGKQNLGQTIYGDYSPESQHHTNQRFFGGRKNVLGIFLGIETSSADLKIKVPLKLRTIPFSKKTLGKLHGESALATMHYDLEGVLTHAVEKNIPAIKLILDKITPENFGEFLVFWQFVSLYSAYLRNVDPFTQPEVERSKEVGLELRLSAKKKTPQKPASF